MSDLEDIIARAFDEEFRQPLLAELEAIRERRSKLDPERRAMMDALLPLPPSRPTGIQGAIERGDIDISQRDPDETPDWAQP